MEAIRQPSTRPKSQREVIEGALVRYFGQMAQVLGFPRSLGEIYGLVFASPIPLSMHDLMRRLGISLGTASQGLAQLKRLGAVEAIRVAGSRRMHYLPQTELRELAGRVMVNAILPRLKEGRNCLHHLEPEIQTLPEGIAEHYRGRVEKVTQWHQLAESTAPLLNQWIK